MYVPEPPVALAEKVSGVPIEPVVGPKTEAASTPLEPPVMDTMPKPVARVLAKSVTRTAGV